ncbi:MAG: class I SAM-dependent methyltransferase [Terracidiphilus sp.]|jgi:SAM-dependent methyltransferase
MDVINNHYDASYFAFQRSGVVLAASLDRWKFVPFIRKDDVVLDFGCGGGNFLASLDCKARYGIEINPVAREEAAKRLTPFAAVDELPEGLLVDVIMSHHALEHVDNPLGVLRALRTRLKPGGLCVFVVPSETWYGQSRFRKGDMNQHLYTWTPLLAGNLFTRAGYEVREATLLCHRWLPRARVTSRLMPARVFDLASRLWSAATFSRQVRVVACNPGTPDPGAPVGHGDDHL